MSSKSKWNLVAFSGEHCSVSERRVKKGLGEMFHVARKTLEFDVKQLEQTAEDSEAISFSDNRQPTRC